MTMHASLSTQFPDRYIDALALYYYNYITNDIEDIPMTCALTYFDNDHTSPETSVNVSTRTRLMRVLEDIAYLEHLEHEFSNAQYWTRNFTANIEDIVSYNFLKNIIRTTLLHYCVNTWGDDGYMEYLQTLL